MSIPNLSYLMKVGQLRHIQACYEQPGLLGPDFAVKHLLTLRQRAECLLRAKLSIGRLRRQPFYGYLLARTWYYDDVYLDATLSNFGLIVNVGCGSDTRAYRFAHLLRLHYTKVIECDQVPAIAIKSGLVNRRWPADQVSFMPIDLNAGPWPKLAHALASNGQRPVLVMMEGVSPYVIGTQFVAFLTFLKATLPGLSRVVYDFKRESVAPGFGSIQGAEPSFRQPDDEHAIAAFHEALGFQVDAIEFSSRLSERWLPKAPELPVFEEDGLLKLSVPASASNVQPAAS